MFKTRLLSGIVLVAVALLTIISGDRKNGQEMGELFPADGSEGKGYKHHSRFVAD